MGLPWSAWTSPSISTPPPPSQTDPLENSTFYHPALLGRVVKDYVEESTDYSPDFAGEEQLGAIMQYCQAPELLDVVLDVLKERMICTWPWNIKSLDILHHLLTHGLSLPQSPAHPRAREILGILTNLSARPTDEPEGTGEHVKRKADECLVACGYWGTPVRGQGQGQEGGRGAGGLWGLGWGRNKDRDKEKEKEREQAELAKTQKAWMDWQAQAQQQQREQLAQQLRQKAGWDSAWTGLNLNVQPSAHVPSAYSFKSGPMTKKNGVGPGILKKPTDSAWVTPLKDGRGFSFSTTTVTEGPPSADHFQQHQSNHASLLEETLRKRR